MYFLVMEYDKKTSFVPPFSIVSHILLFIRWLVFKICRKEKGESKLVLIVPKILKFLGCQKKKEFHSERCYLYEIIY